MGQRSPDFYGYDIDLRRQSEVEIQPPVWFLELAKGHRKFKFLFDVSITSTFRDTATGSLNFDHTQTF